MSAGLKNLSLFQQLFIPMIVVSVISASITMFAGLALRDAVFVAKSSLKNSEEFVRRLQDVEISIASMRLLSLRHLTAENARLMEQTERDLEVQERALHEGIKMLVGRNIEGQNLAIRVRSDLEETFNRYWPQINKATRLSRDFEKESAFSLWFEAESIYGVSIDTSVQKLRMQALNESAASRDLLMVSIQRSITITFAIAMLGGIIVLVIASIFSRRVVDRLASLLDWSRRIGAGDLSKPTLVTHNDEIGELIRGMEYMVESLDTSRRHLDLARDKAERASAAKSVFLAYINHELRTPMNAVLGLAEVGLRQNRGHVTERLFCQMLDSGQLLLGVVNNVLDFSKIEAGKLKIEDLPISVKRLTDHLCVLFEGCAKNRNILFSINVNKNMPQWLLGDFLRITQVLGNLLSNAIKFTERGSVTLTIAHVDAGIEFRIADTGIGMSTEQVGRLFKAFEQAELATTRKFGGTGLGLVITRDLIELMGGTIKVSSEPNIGSTFVVYLPLSPVKAPEEADSHETDEALTAPVGNSGRLVGYRILSAEDNPVNQLVLEEMLSIEGGVLSCAKDGVAALERIECEGPDSWDIVLTDVQMPRMDGHQLAQRIRDLYPNLPTIGITAQSMVEERDRCLASGMKAFLSKPIDIDLLVEAIRNYARKTIEAAVYVDATLQSIHATTSPQPTLEPDPPEKDLTSTDVIDWPALVAAFGHRPNLTDKLITATLESSAEVPEAIRTAIEQCDLSRIGFIAHSLKGLGANLKARRVNGLALQAKAAATAGGESEATELAAKLAEATDELLKALKSRAATANARPA